MNLEGRDKGMRQCLQGEEAERQDKCEGVRADDELFQAFKIVIDFQCSK